MATFTGLQILGSLPHFAKYLSAKVMCHIFFYFTFSCSFQQLPVLATQQYRDSLKSKQALKFKEINQTLLKANHFP